MSYRIYSSDLITVVDSLSSLEYGYTPEGSCHLRRVSDDALVECLDSEGFVYDDHLIKDSVVKDWNLVSAGVAVLLTTKTGRTTVRTDI